MLFDAALESFVISPAGQQEFIRITRIKQPGTITDPLDPGVDCGLQLWWHLAGAVG